MLKSYKFFYLTPYGQLVEDEFRAYSLEVAMEIGREVTAEAYDLVESKDFPIKVFKIVVEEVTHYGLV